MDRIYPKLSEEEKKMVLKTFKLLQASSEHPEQSHHIPKPQDPAILIPPDTMGRAARLVSAAHINAITIFVPLQSRFPVLQGLDLDRWDLIVTIAGVFVALTRLRSLCMEEAIKESVEDIVSTRLNEWDNRAIYGFDDCKTFYERSCDTLSKSGVDQEWVSSDALGCWIAWNVLGRCHSSTDELQIARVMGSMVIHDFFNWWTD